MSLDLVIGVAWLSGVASFFIAPITTPFFVAAMFAIMVPVTIRFAKRRH